MQSVLHGSQPIYLDYNATTPIAYPVMEAITQQLTVFGNPSSIHQPGQRAKGLIEHTRQQVAELLNVQSNEVFFTGSGSEANNMAIKGVALGAPDRSAHIITSQVEHPSVLAACRYLETLGYAVTYLPVDSSGRIDPDDLRRALRPSTCLISIMYANNEIGVLQPVEELGRIAREANVLFHTDAVQIVGKQALDLEALPVDLLSLTAHKFYGPKGIGALVMRGAISLTPLIHGGGQEHGLRAGTENFLGIVGLGAASELAHNHLDHDTLWRQQALRNRLYEGLLALGDVRLNGDLAYLVPGTLNLSFRYIKGDALATALSFHGISVSTGSACHAHERKPSHVLQALGVSEEWLYGSIRFSIGRQTTVEEIDHTLAVIETVVTRLRKMSPLSRVA